MKEQWLPPLPRGTPGVASRTIRAREQETDPQESSLHPSIDSIIEAISLQA